MSLLPIVERELRVASRRKSTFRMRTLLALAVVVIWFLLLLTSNSSTAEKGSILFIAIGVLALGFGLLAGIFLTADCLSEEKREGTLGLLFLTDLEGYDVVMGKLIATSLHAAYGLVAVLPVLALPLMMGGVTVGEFWRVTLVLVVTLFLSLSLGMVVSAVSQETRQAMTGTLLAILIFAGLLPVLWWFQRWAIRGAPWDVLLWPSPGFLYSRVFESCFAYKGGAREFWASLGTIVGLGLCALVAASVYLPRAWHVADESAGATKEERRARRRQVDSPTSRWVDRSLLQENPFFWLTNRDRLPQRLALGVLVPLLLIWACFLYGLSSSSGKTLQICIAVTMFMAFGIHQVLKVLIAVEASRRLSEDRRSGALELLLVSPLPVAKIVSGQRATLRRIFNLPIALVLLTNAGLFWAIVLDNNQLKANDSAKVAFSEMLIGGGLMLLVDFLALSRIGMWMALRTRRHDRAILGTFLRVMLLPWLGVLFFFFLTIGGGVMTEDTVEILMAFWFIGCVVLDLGFAGRASLELERQMRRLCAGLEPKSWGREPDDAMYQGRRREEVMVT
jgi:hypothetical protein